MRWLRIGLGFFAAFAVVGVLGWRWLTAREPVPEATSYRIDVDALHRLAESLPGAKPRAIRSLLVAEAALPRGIVFAGEPITAPQPMVHQVFQLVWDDRFALIDTALPPDGFEQLAATSGDAARYDAAAWGRLTEAFEATDFVVVTHEHFDHLSGASAFPEARASRLLLNEAQLANTGQLDASEISPALRAGAGRLDEAEMQALAPGVVRLAAPGHTPGSQMLYVERADGRAALFLGDVAWNMEQIRQLHYRPRLVTLLIGENRAQVLAQFRALHMLEQSRPALALVSSHDPAQRAALLADGLLVDGFE